LGTFSVVGAPRIGQWAGSTPKGDGEPALTAAQLLLPANSRRLRRPVP
jgi:hypothetical protein